MKVLGEVVIGRWRVKAVLLEYGLVGLMLYGPREKYYYIPPIALEPEKLPLPKTVAEFLRPILAP